MVLSILCIVLSFVPPGSPPGSEPPAAGDAAASPAEMEDRVADTPPADGKDAGDTPNLTEVTSQVIDHVGKTFAETPWTGWALLFSGILGGLIAGRILQVALRRVGERLRSRGWVARGSVFNYAAGPASLAVFVAGLAVGMSGVVLDETMRPVVMNLIGLLYVVALGWFLYNLVDIIELGIRRITTDQTIIQLIRKAVRIFLLIIFGLFVAENFFGANISAWLAGLGLAGLAVSLAAQGPIKNLFGSVTVVLDRPFGLNDLIKYNDVIGTVEVMGFRSTKIRTHDGHVVTIPNSKLIEDSVENITARKSIRRLTNITITYDTPPEKVEQALQIIKNILAEPWMTETFDMEKFPPRVVFNNFNADSLNILVVFWYQLNVAGRDWWTYNAQIERFNLSLLRAYNDAGIDFAFPTQTLYLAGDSKRELAIRFPAEFQPN